MADLASLFDKSGAGYWKTRSDDELLEMEFTTDDPESLENVSNDPPPDEEAMVELAYNVAGRERGRAQCVFCKHPNHDRGVVMLYRDGQRRLVGRDCAHKRYGVVFDELVKDFDAAKDRRDYVERQRTILSKRADLVDLIRTMRLDPNVAAFSDTRQRLSDFLGPAAWGRLVRVADGDGYLATEERLRDYGREETRGGSHVRGVIVRGDVLRGADLVRSGPSVAERLLGIEREVEGVLATLNGQDVTTRSIRVSLVRLGELMRQIEEQRIRMRGLISFFDNYNLLAVAGWLRKLDPRSPVVTATLPDRFVMADGRDPRECGPPGDYRVPGGALIAIMQEAVSAQRKVDRAS
ncbi:hypothetical protein [Methylobacterium sp. sgz302541]|uniref:hypothetical protein n=1 Tax=unclassified Methylobacterium TaxID=2615210 RepID=UPI003D348C04